MPEPRLKRYITLYRAVAAALAAVLLFSGCLNRGHEYGIHDDAHIEITLLTTNDLHGRLDPFTIKKNHSPRLAGGFAALAARMDLIEQHSSGPVLRFDSGDTLTGPYAAQFNGEALFGGLSRMNIDAATLGNHDFDRGPAVLAQALTHCSFPVIVTNIALPPGHELAQALVPFHVFKRAGKRLLVIGLLTPDLQRLSNPGPDVSVLDPGSEKIRSRIKQLIRHHRPELVIALTHLGLEEDRRLAEQLPEIDIICGAHSHDLLPPGNERVVNHADGRTTVIVQAGSGGIALGVLRVKLGKNSQPDFSWQPQEIDASSARCPRMLAFIERYRSGLPSFRMLTSTATEVDCRGDTLRSREAPIGNFIADSMRARFKTDVALYNGGGIRGDYTLPPGPISSMDVETMLPFGNETVVVSMTGAMLKQVLELSVSQLPRPWGGFLQVSGLRMRVDPRATPASPQHTGEGRRIIAVDIQAADGLYRPLVPECVYRIAINTFLAKGGNGYCFFKEAESIQQSGERVRDTIMALLAARPQHSFVADGRISIQAKPLKQLRQHPAHSVPYPPSPGMGP